MDTQLTGDRSGGGLPAVVTAVIAPRGASTGTNSTEAATEAEKRKQYRMVLTSLVLGTGLEWYNFGVSAQMDGPLAFNFFPPTASPETKALGYWLVYAVAFMARPLGALIFGSVADARGRRITLLTTIVMMGLATMLAGCLPSYATAGPVAPIVLALLRLAMGLALGGEFTTAIVYVNEASLPQRVKSIHASIIAASSAMGSLAGVVVVIILEATLSIDQLNDWGWRLPFLLAAPCLTLTLWLRLHMHETDEFVSSQQQQEELQQPSVQSAKGNSQQTGGQQLQVLPNHRPQQTQTASAGVDGDGLPAAVGAPSATTAGWRCLAPCLRRSPAAQLLRTRPWGFLLHTVFAGWILSAYYLAYAWAPSHLRGMGLSPVVSQAMVFSALLLEMGTTILGGWAAGKWLPCLSTCACMIPVVTALFFGVIAVFDTGSVAGSWVALCVAFWPACTFLLGVHAGTFVHIYDVTTRSLGFSLAYSAGCALGGAAPAIATALQTRPAWHSDVEARFAPAFWLLALSGPALAAVLALLLHVARGINRPGRLNTGATPGAP